MRAAVWAAEGVLGGDWGLEAIGARLLEEGAVRDAKRESRGEGLKTVVDDDALRSWAEVPLPGWSAMARASRILTVVAARLLRSLSVSLSHPHPYPYPYPGTDEDLGLVVGSRSANAGAIATFERKRAEVGPALVNPLLFPETVPNAAAGHAAIRCGIAGPATTLVGGSLCGVYALEQALDWLGEGRVPRVLTGGFEELQSWGGEGAEGAALLLLVPETEAGERERTWGTLTLPLYVSPRGAQVREAAAELLALVGLDPPRPAEVWGLGIGTEELPAAAFAGEGRAVTVKYREGKVLWRCPGAAAALATALSLKSLSPGQGALLVAASESGEELACWAVARR